MSAHKRVRERVTVLVAAAVAALVVACAQPGAPPGGPPDAELPVLLKVLPESNAVNVRTPAVVLQFDEVISERSTAVGVQSSGAGNSLASLVLLSPSDGRDEVIWRRDVLELRPRRGFRPNTTYRVTVAPGLADLRGNRTSEAFDFVFSTGPNTAAGEVRGVLFDWTTGKAAVNARVELFRDGDSTFRWTTRSDSAGRFRVRDLNAGDYELRAWLDANNDRRISAREVSDSARVSITDDLSLELYAYLRDTVAPQIEALELVDSTGIRLRFDRGIVHDWDGSGALLLAADSSVIPLGGPMIPAARFDSLARQRRAAADSAAKTPDSTAVDSAAAKTGAGRPSAAAITPAAADSVASDTTPPPPVFGRMVPVTTWTVPLTAPLTPGTYRFRISGARGLNGRAAAREREFRVRPPAAPADSTKAPAAPATQPAAPSGGVRRP